MKLTVAAIGRAKSGPEAALFSDYAGRLDALGRAARLGPLSLLEIDGRGRGAEAESAALLERTAGADRRIVLDERGKALSSEAFAALLGAWRDEGVRETAFLIGGADGHTAAVRARADRLIAFGPATWPHLLARAMLAEQLYRAAAIAANHPYHRGG